MKESFIMYLDYEEHLALLSDEERGRLLSALFEYARTGIPPELDGMARMAFSFIKAQMDRDAEKWQKTCEARMEAGKKGGCSKSAKRKQGTLKSGSAKQKVANVANATFARADEANASKTKQSVANVADNDNENVNENVNVNDIPPISPEGLFDRFWSAYPRKTAKQNALKAFHKLNVTEALLTEMLAALDWQRQSKEWQKDGGQFIPHPATWLNGRRWEDLQTGTSDSFTSVFGDW